MTSLALGASVAVDVVLETEGLIDLQTGGVKRDDLFKPPRRIKLRVHIAHGVQDAGPQMVIVKDVSCGPGIRLLAEDNIDPVIVDKIEGISAMHTVGLGLAVTLLPNQSRQALAQPGSNAVRVVAERGH